MSPKRLLHITIWVIIFSIIAEAFFFAILNATGRTFSFAQYLADFCNRIIFTYIVCVSVSLAQSLTQNNAPATGLAGLLSVPPALYLAGLAQKAVTEALGMDASETGLVLFIPLAIKTVEYALLALVLAWMAKQHYRAGGFFRTGLLFGLLAGAAQSWYRLSTDAEFTFLGTIVLVVNEMIVPAFCAAIIYNKDVIAKKI